VITGHAPAMEGGIAVAPASFGRYGGDIGVESAGFMLPRLSAGDAAYLADRSPTPAVSPAVRSLPALEPEAASRGGLAG
jgi:hypothetical protein